MDRADASSLAVQKLLSERLHPPAPVTKARTPVASRAATNLHDSPLKKGGKQSSTGLRSGDSGGGSWRMVSSL